ncbi:glucose-1-phosphate adenylyltransferase large subunit, chloroplastic/amyloplastic-like isoform X2 [Malania oleifera]|uniref:glucose-1-phosphate adenylyltransferase large subunit, chloroplastic/amyloplastic-like isoform X2 n=1 Tax=Malania oleifera TaxID=397392 RepID=UPI0025AE48F0|nr:glucose-1-phosphate adenylyltransferase large subunit, chloroplastic/amyloplastic-like isoform X2 [Malania oleifera]
MDIFCATMNTNGHPLQASKGRISNGGGGFGFWGERIRGSLKRRDSAAQLWKTLRTETAKARKINTGAAFSVLTSDVDQEALTFQSPIFESPKADPTHVASIILGGGAGTRLFPLTSRRAKPAVLAATQTPGEAGKKWFQGTADAVRQFIWVFEDAKTKNVEHILILSGDHLYRMDYMDFVQKHIDSNADITVSCVPMDDSHASDYGLMKIDSMGRIIQFAEKPKGPNLKAMQVDTTILGLSEPDALKYPYIASMGVYVFRTDVLLDLLKWRYPSCNDFGSEIIPFAVMDRNVQAYLFNDYWEDIGTIKSFFDANLALTEQPPKFEFYDPKTPFFTSPRYLPPTKVDKCKVVDSIISHGCFLRECSIQHSVVGVRSRLEYGVELKDTMMMGADYYQTESEIASLLAEGKVPIGVGQHTKIRNCIIDKNAKIGKEVVIANKDGVQEADRPREGFYIRSGITVILKNATIKDGTVI